MVDTDVRRVWELEIDRSLFPRLLQELGVPDLLVRLFKQVMPNDAGVQVDKAFPKFGKQHGWETFADGLVAVIDATTSATLARNVALLEALCLQRDKAADRIALCRRLAERLVAAVEKIDARPPKQHGMAPEIDRAALLASLVKSLATVEADEPLERMVGHALSSAGRSWNAAPRSPPRRRPISAGTTSSRASAPIAAS